MAASEVGNGGRAIVTEHKHEHTFPAMLRVIGIVSYQSATMDEPGDLLVTRIAGACDQINRPRRVSQAGDCRLATLHGLDHDRINRRRVLQSGGCPARGRDLIRGMRQRALTPGAEARESRDAVYAIAARGALMVRAERPRSRLPDNRKSRANGIGLAAHRTTRQAAQSTVEASGARVLDSIDRDAALSAARCSCRGNRRALSTPISITSIKSPTSA